MNMFALRSSEEGGEDETVVQSISAGVVLVDHHIPVGLDERVNEYKQGSSGGGSLGKRNDNLLFHFQDVSRMLYQRKQEMQRRSRCQTTSCRPEQAADEGDHSLGHRLLHLLQEEERATPATPDD